MDDIMASVKDIATEYIDDILVGTTVEPGENLLEAHARDLRRVLSILQTQKMVVDPSKAKMFVDEVEFCGQILGNGNRRPAPGKLMEIEKWENPNHHIRFKSLFRLHKLLQRIYPYVCGSGGSAPR